MSSESEEENGLRHNADSDGGQDDRTPRSHSKPQLGSRSRSRYHSPTRQREPTRKKDMRGDMSDHDQDDMQDGKENGSKVDSYAEMKEPQRRLSRSKSPEDNEAWRSNAMEKRASRSRSKSKPKEREPSKEPERKSSSSQRKKSRSRSRSRRRSHSRSRSRSSRSRSRSSRHSRSRSRSPPSRNKRQSRSRSRDPRPQRYSDSRSGRPSMSRSGTPEDGARLHVAELDVDTRKKDLERVFEKYGRLREIWMARNPPCFAFVVYAHQRDADKALKETNGIMIGHCRIKVIQARPRVRGGRMRGGYDPNQRGGRMRGGQDPNRRCYQCGGLGHFSRNCTDTKLGYSRPQTPPGSSRMPGRSRYRSRSRSRSRYSRSRSRS